MYKLFALLVASATLIGTLFIENPQIEAMLIQQNVMSAFDQAREYVSENPKQLTGSALTMFASTVVWFFVIGLVRNSRKHGEAFTPEGKQDTVELINPIIAKVQNRSIYERLGMERAILIGRAKWLPEQIEKAKARLSNAQSEELMKEIELASAEDATRKAQRDLDTLLNEHDTQSIDLANMDREMKRLQNLI